MQLWRYLRKKYYGRQVRREEAYGVAQWLLQFRWQDSVLGNDDLSDMHKILPPDDRFYADPFPASDHGRDFIFFEEYPYDDPIGFISVVEVFKDGSHGEPVPVIKCPYHLSYPWLFKQNGTWYMLPETHQNQTIEIWECEEFPYRWRKAYTLMENVIAADTTPFFHENQWWLFTSLKKDCKKFGDKLFLFHSDNLFGNQWQPHSQNPVRQGLVYDRPAGNLFIHEGKLIRPVQDSVKRYGGAVEFREVCVLSHTHYCERAFQRLEPTWEKNICGVHTYNYQDGLLVVDALRIIPRPGKGNSTDA